MYKFIDENMYKLSNREKVILKYLAEGFDNKTIANKTSVSVHTVKAMVRIITKKVGARNRTHTPCQSVENNLCKL